MTAITFLVGTAGMQLLILAAIGALVNAPVVHVCVFIAYTFISTYLIYGVPGLGRLWIWTQIPTVTAFYMVLFDHRGLGWDNAQMFAGLVVAVTMLWLFDSVIWPKPAAAVLSDSLRSTLERSRLRLELLMRIFLAEDGAIPKQDHGVASKLAYHLTLLEPSIRTLPTFVNPRSSWRPSLSQSGFTMKSSGYVSSHRLSLAPHSTKPAGSLCARQRARSTPGSRPTSSEATLLARNPNCWRELTACAGCRQRLRSARRWRHSRLILKILPRCLRLSRTNYRGYPRNGRSRFQSQPFTSIVSSFASAPGIRSQ
ncbi:MAG TPA: hypothetical protein VMD75_17395 [Candidatus Binataceae bacterium]|nr:hypothetical protein [Candidatus Binataceae bacterium]